MKAANILKKAGKYVAPAAKTAAFIAGGFVLSRVAFNLAMASTWVQAKAATPGGQAMVAAAAGILVASLAIPMLIKGRGQSTAIKLAMAGVMLSAWSPAINRGVDSAVAAISRALPGGPAVAMLPPSTASQPAVTGPTRYGPGARVGRYLPAVAGTQDQPARFNSGVPRQASGQQL